MTRRLRIKKQNVKESLIALGTFLTIGCLFWRVILYGYPSDLETAFIIAIPVIALIKLLLDDFKRRKR